jgi:hypothetical protein
MKPCDGGAHCQVIDSHLHCGIQHVSWGWEQSEPLLRAAGIQGAVLIPPVEDIYDRFHPHFTDSPAWQECRRRAHRYILDLKNSRKGAPMCAPGNFGRTGWSALTNELEIFPYFFVWNDFAWEDLGPDYVGVKWHRHADEPEYHYNDPRCREFLEVVRGRRLPILLEETFRNTMFFLERLAAGIPVIIPHLGALSGGYREFVRAGVWDRPLIYADMAVAPLADIEDYLSRYGARRLLFGSDYPFSRPQTELDKILGLELPENETRAILGENFRRLCNLEAMA